MLSSPSLLICLRRSPMENLQLFPPDHIQMIQNLKPLKRNWTLMEQVTCNHMPAYDPYLYSVQPRTCLEILGKCLWLWITLLIVPLRINGSPQLYFIYIYIYAYQSVSVALHLRNEGISKDVPNKIRQLDINLNLCLDRLFSFKCSCYELWSEYFALRSEMYISMAWRFKL